MRKLKHIVVLFLLLFPLLATAQKIRMTVRAGMNFTQISGPGALGFNHFGFVGGVGVNWRFHKRFSFDPEILYSMKGTRRNPDPDNGVYTSLAIDLDYIEIPALFRWHFDRKDRFSLEFGTTFGFLVRRSLYDNAGEITPPPDFNVFELGLAVGFNFHLPKGWGINARVGNSIIPIQPTIPSPPVGVNIINFGPVNTVLSASLTYSFGFKKIEGREAKDPAEIKPPKPPKIKKPKKQRGDVIDED
jgi:hypothetical protein